MLKVSEMRGLAKDELLEKLAQLKKNLMQYRFQAKTGKLEAQSVLRVTRRDIARIMTVINEGESQRGAKKTS